VSAMSQDTDDQGVEFAQPEDAPRLSAVIAAAFRDLAPSAWLVPDQAERARIFPDYFRLYVDHAMASGVVYTTAERDAVALWLPAGAGNEPPPADYDTRLAAVTGSWVDRFRAFDEQLEKHHPTGERHHHLAILAVHPERQGRGLGSALLAAHHSALDEAAKPLPAYLEAAGVDSRRLYARHGYQDMDSILSYPDGLSNQPMMYPMWRPPRGSDPR
jgi:GNAT superfamily N-acetyltransferase